MRPAPAVPAGRPGVFKKEQRPGVDRPRMGGMDILLAGSVAQVLHDVEHPSGTETAGRVGRPRS